MFGINLTKRRIDEILSEYDDNSIKEAFNKVTDYDSRSYFQPLNPHTRYAFEGLWDISRKKY